MNKIKKGNLTINLTLFDFINQEVIPGTDIANEDFWNKFDLVVHELTPINRELIKKRENIQKKIDEWHIANKGKEIIKNDQRIYYYSSQVMCMYSRSPCSHYNLKNLNKDKIFSYHMYWKDKK